MKLRIATALLAAFLAFSAPAAASADALTSLLSVSGDIFAIGVGIGAFFVPQWTPTSNQFVTETFNIDGAFFNEGLENGSYAWGVSYERAVNNFLSVKVRTGLFDHEMYWDVSNTCYYQVNIIVSDVYLCWNFEGKGLKGLNIDLGFGYGHSIATATPDRPVLTNSTWTPQNEYFIPYVAANIGWRFNFGNLMIEPYYNFIRPMVRSTHLSETGIHTEYIDMIGLNVGAEL